MYILRNPNGEILGNATSDHTAAKRARLTVREGFDNIVHVFQSDADNMKEVDGSDEELIATATRDGYFVAARAVRAEDVERAIVRRAHGFGILRRVRAYIEQRVRRESNNEVVRALMEAEEILDTADSQLAGEMSYTEQNTNYNCERLIGR